MIARRERESFLAELEAFGQWLAEGAPAAENVLSAADRAFWTEARDRGQTVPPEILEQL
jgi:hypothetical protein